MDTDFPANLQRIPEQAFGSHCADRLVYQVLYMGRVTSLAAMQGIYIPYLFQLVSFNLNPEKLIWGTEIKFKTEIIKPKKNNILSSSDGASVKSIH